MGGYRYESNLDDSVPYISEECSTTSENSANPLRARKRQNLPSESVQILKDWIYNRRYDPYPKEFEKAHLVRETGLPLHKVTKFFGNVKRLAIHCYGSILVLKYIYTKTFISR